jgi:ketosteroid isomerase-like protein
MEGSDEMISPEELVRRLYSARFANDVEGVLACMAEDATFTMVGTLPIGPLPAMHGKTELRAKFNGLFSRWDWSGMAIRQLIVGQAVVVVEVEGFMHEVPSGARFKTALCDFHRVSGGLVTDVREYVDTFAMARTAGLGP